MMTFDENLKREELTAAQIVAQRVELDRVAMVSGSFAIKAPLEDLPKGLVVDHVLISHKYEFSSEKNVLTVFIHYVCHGHNAAVTDETSAVAFDSEATFVLQYHLTVPPPPEDKRDGLFLGFAKVNGVFNSWPYLREFVQSSTMRAGVAGVTLPVFRVPQLPQAQPQQQASLASQGEMPKQPHKERKRATAS